MEIRGYSKSYYISAILGIVLGAALLVWPQTSMQTFCYVLGTCSVVLGLVKIVMYFMKDRLANLMQPDLVVGISALAFGIFVLVKSEFVLSFLPFLTGVFLLLGAVIKLQSALDLRHLGLSKWWLILIAGAASLILGILLVVNPFEAARVAVILIGAGLLADGAVNLLDMFLIRSLYKKARKTAQESKTIDTEEYYDGPFRDSERVENREQLPQARQKEGRHL